MADTDTNTTSRSLLEQAKSVWNSIPGSLRLVGLTGVFVAIAASAFFGVTEVQDTPTAVLFANLSNEDAAMIARRLRTEGVRYDMDETGTTVLVAKKKLHDTRLMLANEGLPQSGRVGFEIFDEQRFGESEFSEKVKYHRALEGELSRTITHLNGVEGARVHLVLPSRSLFASKNDGASASIALKLHPGTVLNDSQTRGIIHLVASSVRNLVPENVTLVDGKGRRIAGGTSDPASKAASDALSYRGMVESAKQQSAQELLDSTLGPGKAVVRIAADVDFSQEERTEETFDPEQVAARSFQVSEERDTGDAQATAGIPGAASNLPGGEPATSTATEEQGTSKRTETRNFEVSKVVRRSVAPVGRIDRLHVAVLVDGTWEGEGEAATFTARTDEELEQIRSVVMRAVGADLERGDQVTVECVPFATIDTEVQQAPPSALDTLDPYIPYVSAILVAILGLVSAFMIRGSAKKQEAAKKAAALAAKKAATSIEVEQVAGRPGLPGAQQPNVLGGGSTESDLSNIRLLSAELAERDPAAAARVVHGWLNNSSTGGA